MYQVNRTTWASVESFAAAFVVNIPTLYTLRRKPTVQPPPIGTEGFDDTIGSGKVSARSRSISEDTFRSEETFDHDPALDKEYGIATVETSVGVFERAAEGNWPLAGPSRVEDNTA
jgi:hypothetical protein